MTLGEDPFIEQLSSVIEAVCKDFGYELVAVQYRRESHGQVLRVIIFHPDGIGVDDCAKVSREVSYLLDVEDIIEQAYSLEVSSPGLDWPLETAKDFLRYKGKTITFSWFEDKSDHEGQGIIKEVLDTLVIIKSGNGDLEIPLSHIKKARLLIKI